MLRSVADASEKDVVTLGFQNLRIVMNDGLSTIPADCLNVCIDVTGAYSTQKTELNISLTAIGLLWTTSDFIAKGLGNGPVKENNADFSSVLKEKGVARIDDIVVNCPSIIPEQVTLKDGTKRENLLFAIFSLLQNLGADDRPEVRNSAVRTLFQILGSLGQKLSTRMWEDCLWNYVFPTLDRASHMAATSSKDEWQGKELGTQGGKAVHMLIHHSRNTAQKQWDETLVLVLGGIARILRMFFPILQNLHKFWSGWETLLNFVENSSLNGNKEVSLAAINCLQTTILSNSHKGNLPLPYLTSILDAYEHVLQNTSNAGNSAYKLKQEVLQNLGELYVQAQIMFDSIMYTRLLMIVNKATKQALLSNANFENEFGNIPPVLRTILEILPLLRPTECISSMWVLLLQEFLHYLPRQESSSHGEAADEASCGDFIQGVTTEVPSFLFAEKLVPVLIDLFQQTPTVEKYIIYQQIIQSLGRCMTTRREHADGQLWRLAVKAFNCILVNYVRELTDNGLDLSMVKSARPRIWKEVADVYEIFLVGYCGRALSSSSLSVTLNTDESLEVTLLDILVDKILKSPTDAPRDILERLVSTLDRCSSRTSSLPVETVELMPPHCSRFSLTCLKKLFYLTSGVEEWNMTRSEVSKISILMLLTRCEYILSRYIVDENDLGDRPFPRARIDEMAYVLQELVQLMIHPDTTSVLPLETCLRIALVDGKQHNQSPHLLLLYPTLCELITSREARIREQVKVLLKIIAKELNLQKLSS